MNVAAKAAESARKAELDARKAKRHADDAWGIVEKMRRMMFEPPARESASPGCVRGWELKVRLLGGKTLFGMACPEHGLQYTVAAYSGEVMKPENMALHNGAEKPTQGSRIACGKCAGELVGDFHRGGGGEVPRAVLHELERVAEAGGAAE